MIAERVRGVAERLEAARASAGSAPRPAGTGRSRRRSRPSRLATTAARARARSTSATFDLDADRRPVAVVRGPVGAPLERAHVTERAAVDAAHVRVQRPLERHPLHAVERAPAGLLAILDPHRRRSIEHMFDARSTTAFSACRCRCARATSTSTCSRARTAGRSSTPGWPAGARTRSRRVARSSTVDAHRDHPLPSRPRRRAQQAPRGDRRAGLPGRRSTTSSASTSGEATTGRSGSPTGSSRHGVPAGRRERADRGGSAYAPFIRYVARPRAAATRASEVDGWEVARAARPRRRAPRPPARRRPDRRRPPAADGSRRRSASIPESRPDPLGDYLESLERTIELAPRARATRATASRSTTRPGGRARSIEHHRERLDDDRGRARRRSRAPATRSRYPLFGAELSAAARRFAVAETLSHLERLVREGRAARGGDDSGRLLYSRRSLDDEHPA